MNDLKAVQPKNQFATPEVSIVVPFFNVEQYLLDAIHSITQDNKSDYELILIDDGSTDQTRTVAQKVAKHNPRVYLDVLETNSGQSTARNRGLSLASGDYVLFLDSDDALRPDCLSFLLALAKEHRAEIVAFGAAAYSDWSNERKNLRFHIPAIYSEVRTISGGEVLKRMFRESTWNPSVVQLLFSRNYLTQNKIQFPEGIIFEDNVFSYFALAGASRVVGTELVATNVRIRIGSTTRSSRDWGAVRSLLACDDLLKNGPAHPGVREYQQDKQVLRYVRKTILDETKRSVLQILRTVTNLAELTSFLRSLHSVASVSRLFGYVALSLYVPFTRVVAKFLMTRFTNESENQHRTKNG